MTEKAVSRFLADPSVLDSEEILDTGPTKRDEKKLPENGNFCALNWQKFS
jgi:hypothetical protein